jgi:hypothetical protein
VDLIVQRVRASSYFICLVSRCLSFTDAEQDMQSSTDKAEKTEQDRTAAGWPRSRIAL